MLSTLVAVIFTALTAYGALCVPGNEWILCAVITVALIANAIHEIISE